MRSIGKWRREGRVSVLFIVRGVQADSLPTFKPAIDHVCNYLIDSDVPTTDVVCIIWDKCLFRANLLDEAMRKNLLDNVRTLHDSNFSDAFINRNLTYKQRPELKARQSQQNKHAAPSLQPPTTSNPSDSSQTVPPGASSTAVSGNLSQ